MRILAGSRVVGLDQCPGFDCPKDPLPGEAPGSAVLNRRSRKSPADTKPNLNSTKPTGRWE